MNSAVLDHEFLPPTAEWRRSGPFVLIAALLHAALLFYPLQQAIKRLDIPPPATMMVHLADAVSPPHPQPSQASAAHSAAVQKSRERQPSHPRPILAVAAEHSHAAPVTTAAPTVIAPAAPAASPTAATGSSSAPAGPPASISPARYDAAYLHNPEPRYPPMSRRLGEEGKVLLKVRVGSDGRPLVVDLEKSSSFTRLDDAALDVVKRWRFVPAKRGDEAIEASVIVPLVFRLEE